MILLGIFGWIQQHLFQCFFVKYFGIECPGCGFQRAFMLLLKGDFSASIRMYPALIPLMAMAIFLLFHLQFKIKYGAEIIKYSFILNVIIIFTNYIIKQIF